MGEKRATIVLIAKDLASGNINKVRAELRTLGTGGGIAARGLGLAQRASGALGGALAHARGRIGEVIGSMGMLAGVGGAAGLAMGLSSAVNQAKNFGKAMILLQTQTGATSAEVESATKGILAMAASVGTTPEILAAGLYHIESAGIRGAKALDILRVAAQGAKVGDAELESVTNALVAAINSGIKGTSDMGAAMGSLNAIVGAGNMRMEDLTAALASGILPTAKAFGLSITDVGAALADMTDQGVPAEEAATRLRMTFSLLGAPTSKAAKQLKSIGLDTLDLARDMRKPGGLFLALTDLKTHLDKSGLTDVQKTRLLSQAFGGGRSSSTILTLLGSLDRLEDKYKTIEKGAGTFDAAWLTTMEDSDFAFEKFSASLSTFAIRLGNAIMPTITEALGGLTDWLTTHSEDLVAGFKGVLDAAKQIGSVVGDAIRAISAAWDAIPGPLRDFMVGGFVVQKASKWLLGTGPLDWLKSIGGGLLGGGGLAGGVKGAVTGAIPVMVMNWPLGFGAGGGVPGVGGGKGGGGSTIGTVAKYILPFLPAAIAIGASEALQNAKREQFAGTSTADLEAMVTKLQARMGKGYGGMGARRDLASENSLKLILDELKRRREETVPTAGSAIEKTTKTAIDTVRAAIASVGNIGKKTLVDRLGEYRQEKTLVAGITKRSIAKYGHTPPKSWVDATFARDLVHKTAQVEHANKTVAEKIGALTVLERTAREHGDTRTAAKIKAAIDRQKAAMVAEQKKLLRPILGGAAAQAATARSTAAVAAKNWHPTLRATINTRTPTVYISGIRVYEAITSVVQTVVGFFGAGTG